MRNCDVAVIGHFSIDSILLPERHIFVALGGSTAYASLTARRLGASVAVISKVGCDFPDAYLWWLSQEGIDVSSVTKVENAQTTRFELKYNDDLSDRSLLLKSKAPSIAVDDLPKSLSVNAVHIAPIAGEITCDVVEKLKGHADVLSLDPQGLVRNFGENGNVTCDTLSDKHILELVNIFKSSANEIEAATGMSTLDLAVKAVHDYGVETVIVTSGMKGALLSVEETAYNIPACKPERFVDPTGAGDAFIGGFLAEYVRGEDSVWCACVGSAAASLVVEAIGPTFSGDKAEIYQRARVLYEKEIKG